MNKNKSFSDRFAYVRGKCYNIKNAFISKKGDQLYYSEKVKRAMEIALKAHEGQVDKAGFPYIAHPMHLAEQFYDEDSVVVALLHDVIEDTDVTIDDLRKEGFNEKVLTALRLLTHQKGVPYMEYVGKIKEDPLARRVKLADLRHNCDVSRGADSDYFKQKRRDCYYPAMKLLTEAEGNLRNKKDEKEEETFVRGGTILIQDKRLTEETEAKKIVKFLEAEGYKKWAYGSRPEGMDKLYVCPDTKVYSFGKWCVGVTKPFAGKAISIDEFYTVFNIYKPNYYRDDTTMKCFFRPISYDRTTGKWAAWEEDFESGEYDAKKTTLEEFVKALPLGVGYVGKEKCTAEYTKDLSIGELNKYVVGMSEWIVRYKATCDDDNAIFYARPKVVWIPKKGDKRLFYRTIVGNQEDGYAIGREHEVEFEVFDGWDGDMMKYLKKDIRHPEDHTFTDVLPKGISPRQIPSKEWIIEDVDDGEYVGYTRLYYTKTVE